MNEPHDRKRPARNRPVIHWSLALAILVLVAGGWLAFDRYQRNAPRREAMHALTGLLCALAGHDTATALSQVEVPTAIAGRPPAEQR